MRDKAIALFSGGLDSCVAVATAIRTHDVTFALTFDYGQRAASREKEATAAFCKLHNIGHRTMSLPWLAELGDSALTHKNAGLPAATPETLDVNAGQRAKAVWVPNRNGLFIAIAAAFAEGLGAKHVIAGFNKEEAATFPDNGKGFIEASNGALSFSTLSKVKLYCPLEEMDKRSISAEFLNLGLNADAFWCCYEGEEKLCGICESCCRTIRAFKAIGRFDAIRHRFAQEAIA